MANLGLAALRMAFVAYGKPHGRRTKTLLRECLQNRFNPHRLRDGRLSSTTSLSRRSVLSCGLGGIRGSSPSNAEEQAAAQSGYDLLITRGTLK